MGARTQKDLYLQVSGNIDPLTAAMKAGRSVLNDFGKAANDTTAEVEAAFKKLGGGDVEASARAMEASFNRTFASIRANAQAVANAPTGASALQILDAGAAEQAAAKAEAQAVALRMVADAAARAAAATEGDGAAARTYAVAAEASALAAEQAATSYRQQATVAANVAGQLRAAGAEQVDAVDELAAAHTRMGPAGMLAEHAVRSVSDSIAAGQSPVTALTMQMGRITEAMALYAQTTGASEGAAGKFAAVMGGPWGIAITAGLAILTPLVGKIFEAGDSLDAETRKLQDNAEKTAIAEEAKKLFLNTEAGAIDDVRALTDELDKQNDALKTNAERLNIRAKLRLEALNDARTDVAAKLADAQARAAITSTGGVAGTGQFGSDQAGIEAGALQARLTAIDKAIALAESDRQRTDADLAAESAKRSIDPLEQIRRKYEGPDGLIEQAKKRAIAEGAVGAALTRQLAEYDRLEKKELADEQKRQQQAKADQHRTDSDNRQSGRQIDLSQAEDIVHGIGGRITSDYRSSAKQAQLYAAYLAGTGPLAAKPGTSEHERGQALDIAKTAGMTLAKIVEAFAAQGVHLTERLDEGNHFHVAWGPKGPSADQMAKRQLADADRAANDDRAFQSEQGQAQDRFARAQLALADTAENRLAVALAELDASKASRDAEIDDQVKAGKISTVQAGILKALNANATDLDREKAQRDEHQAVLDRQLTADRDALDDKIGLLQLQGDLATTTAERRRIALQLLALEEQEARDAANRKLQSDDPTVQAQGTRELASIDAQHDGRVAQIDRQNADPLDSYRDQLQRSVGDTNEALKGVEADGLKGLEDGLVGIVTGTESVAGAFKKMAASILADLARIAAEKLILSVIGLKDGGAVPGFALGGLPGFAGGGDPFVDQGIIRGPGTGRSDSILALVGGRRPIRISNGEAIVNERGVRKHWPLIKAINDDRLDQLAAFADGGLVSPDRIFMRSLPSAASIARPTASPAPITFDLRGAVVTEDLLRQMNDLSMRHATAAVLGGSQLAQQDLAERSAQAIPS